MENSELTIDQQVELFLTEYVKETSCICARVRMRSMVMLSKLTDHEPLFRYLLKSGWQLEIKPIATWQFYADADIDRVRCFLVDEQFNTMGFSDTGYSLDDSLNISKGDNVISWTSLRPKAAGVCILDPLTPPLRL